MKDRIKAIRLAQHPNGNKERSMTQQEFAERIQVERSTLARYELGIIVPSNAVISLICKEFKVNEAWLREGVGEMFREKTRDEELSEFFGEVLSDKPEDFRRRLVTVLSRLDVEHWHLLEEMARKLAETEKADPDD